MSQAQPVVLETLSRSLQVPEEHLIVFPLFDNSIQYISSIFQGPWNVTYAYTCGDLFQRIHLYRHYHTVVLLFGNTMTRRGKPAYIYGDVVASVLRLTKKMPSAAVKPKIVVLKMGKILNSPTTSDRVFIEYSAARLPETIKSAFERFAT